MLKREVETPLTRTTENPMADILRAEVKRVTFQNYALFTAQM